MPRSRPRVARTRRNRGHVRARGHGRHGTALTTVRVIVRGDFSGEPAVSEDVVYEVELAGDASHEQLEELVLHVDAIAKIPTSLRQGTPVTLGRVRIIA